LRQCSQFKACYTDYWLMDAHGNILADIETPWYPRVQAISSLLSGVYINGSTVLIERSCFGQVGIFSERLRYTQDAEMWLRLLREFEIGRTPEKLVGERFHSERGSRNRREHKAEKQIMFRQIWTELGVAGLFPELAGAVDEARATAQASQWFADQMAFSHGLFVLADELYHHSVAVWPSWRNPARLKRIANRILGILAPVYLPIRYALRQTMCKPNRA